MIVIDDRFLSDVTQDEFWLMMQLAKRLKQDGNQCWPSNDTLIADTGWSESKFRAVRKKCISKGFIKINNRFAENGRQTSNVYEVATDKVSFIKSFLGYSGEVKEDESNRVVKNTTLPKNTTGEGSKKQHPHYIEQENFNKEQVLADESATNKSSKKTIEERAIEFKEHIRQNKANYQNTMLHEFYNYWTEHNKNGRKMRFELEKVFDIKRRLKTWFNRSQSKTFTRGGAQTEPTPQVYIRPKQNTTHQQTPIENLLATAAQKMAV